MYRWCSYCQKFLGEKEPLKDFSITHGICAHCKKQMKLKAVDCVEKSKELGAFFSTLRDTLLLRKSIEASEVVRTAKKLGIAPTDLLAGVIQPLLYEIAELQNRGQATVIQEHCFSQMVEQIFYEIEKGSKRQIKSPSRCDVVLACADGNYHYFGIKFLQEYLEGQGVRVATLYPSCPFSQVLDYADQTRARVIGISVALPLHLKNLAKEWEKALPSIKIPLELVVGGQGIRQMKRPPKNFRIYEGDPREFHEFISSVLHRRKVA